MHFDIVINQIRDNGIVRNSDVSFKTLLINYSLSHQFKGIILLLTKVIIDEEKPTLCATDNKYDFKKIVLIVLKE